MAVSGEGFPRSCRLNRPSQYQHVFRSNRRSVDSQFLVLARRNGLKTARLGLAVSKRNIRTATGRNRVKRLIRESFRRNRIGLAGLDVVVVSQKGISASDNQIILQSLGRHWERIASETGVD